MFEIAFHTNGLVIKMEANGNKYRGVPQGTCDLMCPEGERLMREREGLLHPFEMLPGTEHWRFPKADPDATVKSYVRSGAGQDTPHPSELRPPHMLKKTVVYLLQSVVPQEEVPWVITYDFVFDRLRAVRQEVVMQDLDLWHCVEILEPIVRFLVYAGYRLCEAPAEQFDPKINKTHLLECLKRLLVMYQECEGEEETLKHRSEMEALYLVVSLGSPEAIVRAVGLAPEWRTDAVELALEVSVAWWNRNYVRACRLATRLPVLLACAFNLHLPLIRRQALLVMNSGFSSRVGSYPIIRLQSLLLYDSEELLRQDCKHYNIKTDDAGVHFLKGTFAKDSPGCSPRQLGFIMDELRYHDLADLLLGAESMDR